MTLAERDHWHAVGQLRASAFKTSWHAEADTGGVFNTRFRWSKS